MKKQYFRCWSLGIIYTLSIVKMAIAQQSSLKIALQKDTVVVEDIKRIQKNIFSITSTVPQSITIVFSTTDTDKINIAFTKTIDTTIQPNSTLYFSIYYKLLDKSNKEWSAIQISVYNKENKLLQQCSFSVHLFRISSWRAYHNHTPYFVLPTVDRQDIVINLYNEGNINELINATIISSSYSKKIVAGWSDSILLPPKGRIPWQLQIPIKYLIEKGTQKATPVIVVTAKNGKAIRIPISILVPSNTYTQTSEINNGGTYIQTEINRIWRNNANQTNLNIDGKIRLDSASYITLQYRNFSFMQYAALPTHFTSVTYQSKTAFLYVGNLIETNDFFMDGVGLRFKRNFSSSNLAFTLAKDRIKDAYFTHWQWGHQIFNKNLVATSQISTYANVGNGIQSTLPRLQLQWSDSNKTDIKFFIGGSREHVQRFKLDTTLLSNMQGYSFFTKWKSLFIQSSLLHYGRNYAGGNRGLNQHNHAIIFKQTPFSVKVFYTSNDRSLLYANDSAFYLLQGVATNEVGTSVSWAHRQFSWQIQPSVFTQSINEPSGIRSNIYKIAYNNRWYRGKNSLTLSGDIGLNQITQQYTTHAYMHHIRTIVSNGDVQLAFEWNKGPYFYYDTKKYLEDGSSLSILYVTLQKAWNFPTNNFSMQSYVTFQSIKPRGENNFAFSHYMQYALPNWKADIALAMQWNTTYKSGNFIQLTVRKRWANDIKSLFKSKKRITLYEDKNGNGHLDNNEALLAYRPVWINEQLLMTNAKGQVAIKRSDVPSYNINLNDIGASANWSPINGYEQQIEVNKNIDIAFQANGIVKGKVGVIKPKFATGTVQLDGIKIYIQNEFNRFTTVTDINGNFEIPVPKGTYNIIVDENTLGDNLVTTIIPQPVDVVSQAPTYVSITLQQKERAIKIKQQ